MGCCFSTEKNTNYDYRSGQDNEAYQDDNIGTISIINTTGSTGINMGGGVVIGFNGEVGVGI